MSLSCGLVGLPNVGKSTLFNAILKKSLAVSANYPFCTIEPNVGKVPVEDYRLQVLSETTKSEKIIPTLLSCVDIAGLVKGASKGEGLGNKFLANIRECDLIIHVLRCFKDSHIVNINDSIDPLRDFEIINIELQLSDLERLDKILDQKKTDLNLKNIAQITKQYLADNGSLISSHWNEDFKIFFTQYGFLTSKPFIVAANVSSKEDFEFLKQIEHLNPIKVFAYFETLLQEVELEERQIFLNDMGMLDCGLKSLIKMAYDKLDLISFLTTGEKETRAWTVKKGDTMQQAAAVIHSDFYKSFISAEVLKYEDFIKVNSWSLAKEKGLVKTCSKDELVSDGDICVFKTYK